MTKRTDDRHGMEARMPRRVKATQQLTPVEDVMSVSDLESDLAHVIRGLGRRARPLIVTNHGRPTAVLMSPAEYDRLTALARLLAAVQEGQGEAARAAPAPDHDSDDTGMLEASLARRPAAPRPAPAPTAHAAPALTRRRPPARKK